MSDIDDAARAHYDQLAWSERILREALESIAKNTCCGGCQEAAKVARAALASAEKGE